MLNRITLIGRLTKSPDLRYTSSGTPVANFTIACERNYKNKQGEKDVDFIKIVTWRGLAKSCAKHLGKGRLVAVEGRLRIEKNNSNGNTYINPKINADNVQFLDWPKDSENKANNSSNQQENDTTTRENERVEEDDGDFDVPF